MSLPAKPLPGIYKDSCGTPYRASYAPKTGWWLQKQGVRPSESFQKPDFEVAVAAGIFTYQTETT